MYYYEFFTKHISYVIHKKSLYEIISILAFKNP